MKRRLSHFVVPAVLAAAFFSTPATAQVEPAMADAIKKEGLENSGVMDYLDALTNTIGHRLTGSDSFTMACDWALAEFRKMGLEAKLEKWDTWPVVWNRGQWQGRVVEPVQMDLHVATAAWTAGTKGRVRAKIFMAPTTEEEFDAMAPELEGAYLFGRPPSTRSGGRRRGRGGGGPRTWQGMAEWLQDHAVAGWIYASSGDAKYPNRIRVFGSRTRNAAKLPTTPEIAVRNDQAKQLRKLIEEAGDDGVMVEFDIRNRFRAEPIDLHNVIAEIPGTEKPGEVVIVCGHLDSWHQATGTTDNGTGTTSTMEAARILAAVGAKPRRTIRFCLWGGEEQGLLGSRGYVQRHRTDMPNVSAVLNHDTGTNWAQSLTVNEVNGEAMEEVVAPILTMTPPDADFDGPVFDLKTRARISGGGGSDHASFITARVPAFAWGLTGRSDYFGYTWHTQWDTFDVAIPEYQRHTSTVIALTALGIANLPEKLSNEGIEPRRTRDMKTVVEGMLGVELKGTGDLVIGKIDDGGRAAKAGFAVGDVIKKVGGEKVSNLREAMSVMRDKGFRTVGFTVDRGGEAVELKQAEPPARTGDAEITEKHPDSRGRRRGEGGGGREGSGRGR